MITEIEECSSLEGKNASIFSLIYSMYIQRIKLDDNINCASIGQNYLFILDFMTFEVQSVWLLSSHFMSTFFSSQMICVVGILLITDLEANVRYIWSMCLKVSTFYLLCYACIM